MVLLQELLTDLLLISRQFFSLLLHQLMTSVSCLSLCHRNCHDYETIKIYFLKFKSARFPVFISQYCIHLVLSTTFNVTCWPTPSRILTLTAHQKGRNLTTRLNHLWSRHLNCRPRTTWWHFERTFNTYLWEYHCHYVTSIGCNMRQRVLTIAITSSPTLYCYFMSWTQH